LVNSLIMWYRWTTNTTNCIGRF